MTGPAQVLPSVYDVTTLASASVAAAALAVAELHAMRTERTLPAVAVDSRAAVAAFRCESLLQADGWELPGVWDPLAGDYPTSNGWVRLHTNYAHHRAAALRALDCAPDRGAIADVLATRTADDLEQAVVDQGGCAAAMRTAEQWSTHPQGRAVAAEDLVATDRASNQTTRTLPPPSDAPLAGIRVLDLTRVIAGPVATRYLAAFGAQVLRIDPPGFDEVPLLVIETTAGKRRAALDLRGDPDRAVFERLLAEAHVVVSGYRNGALDVLGLTTERLRTINPDLVHVRLDAYGWTGPWAGRRGFDSLVQMSSGIAARGQVARGADQPVPLPAQALDHATGYLTAAAAVRGLTDGLRGEAVAEARLSLARTAALLASLGVTGDIDGPPFAAEAAAAHLEPADTAWGPVQRVRIPGTIEGVTARLLPLAGPLGTDRPAWNI